MTTSAELEIPAVTVSPGGEATTGLTVRNGGDIVEAYSLEVVGDCAAWTTVEPARVSLYPGTSETVTVRLAPPRSPEVRAGQMPLGIRVLPAEHPEAVSVPETTVHVEAFHELRAELEPHRRRGWLGARYRTAVRNLGNTPVDVTLGGRQDGEELRFGFAPERPALEPGESVEVGLRVRVHRLTWFGPPVTWPFELDVTEAGTGTGTEVPGGPVSPVGPVPAERREALRGEFVQLSVLPKWLLAVLAALLALLLAWFTLVRPAVRSAAEEAADKAVRNSPAAGGEGKQSGGSGTASGGKDKPGSPATGGTDTGAGTGTGAGPGAGSGGGGADTVPGSGRQSSATIDVQTDGGAEKVGTYRVPAGKILGITDVVVANFQGDEGVLTITFGDRKITTIALETFRNQDYHWVTPLGVPENATVTAAVTCAKPGTPATGQQASGCHEVLNVSGVMSDLKP
ncbi:COG1470 family protein [Streptomyces albireticuli]|uniref:COG1470 family protein n=1 Tax=Streptomyces albireticuli TaxID=1940 RepID=UPI0036B27B09